MTVTGQVFNKRTGSPIPYASVTLVNEFGDYLGIGTAADQLGRFSMNSPAITDPNALLFTSSGYNPLAVDALLVMDGDNVAIRLEEKSGMENIIITTVKKKGTWIFLAALLLLTTKKKR
jgi:hypothetical protein